MAYARRGAKNAKKQKRIRRPFRFALSEADGAELSRFREYLADKDLGIVKLLDKYGREYLGFTEDDEKWLRAREST
jgi:hypothetical protein